MKALLSWVFLLIGVAPVVAHPVDYLRQVKPLLARNCYSCHGSAKQRAELRLDTVARALKGGASGPALVPGQSGKSLLIRAVTGADDHPIMPPKEPRLDQQQIALLRRWIDEGAKAPRDEVGDTASVKKHWAFEPVKRSEPPTFADKGWPRTAIDRFILARLEKEKLAPSPEADRVTLIRRLALDLTGLPPTPREVEEFVNDKAPDAYEKLVERLLASPHYGERWGRHWLDSARYADSNGYSIDAARTIWPYRDWVINAVNKDMPFDQFTIEQLAGDLLPGARRDQKVATGFHRNTLINQEGGIDREQFRVDAIVDRVNTTGSVWLGLTIGCAQCHNHKFDPIAQEEYYKVFALFNSVDEPSLEVPTPEQEKNKAQAQKRLAALEKSKKEFDRQSAAGMAAWEKALTPETKAELPPNIQLILTLAPEGRNAKQKEALLDFYRRADLYQHAVAGFALPTPYLQIVHVEMLNRKLSRDREIAALKKSLDDIPVTMVVQERTAPRKTHVMMGGDFTRPGKEVSPGVPAVLPPLEFKGKPTRLDFARWLVDAKNPLTARVTVNRVWQQYFGLGLVETENDFGTQGTAPSHPELLDWLASEFVGNKWSLKALHRLIVNSAVYRQASRQRDDLLSVDARNRLLARQNRLRLEAEIVRDNALAASGLLCATIGGPSVFPTQPEGVYAFTQIKRDWKASPGEDRYRRGMYTHLWRSAPHPGLIVFDAPEANFTCTRRNRSNTPLQALTLLNDQAFFECAQALGLRVLTEARGSDEERLSYLFRLCLARAPRPREAQTLLRFLKGQLDSFAAEPAEARQLAPQKRSAEVDAGRAAAWAMTARVVLNLDEFITRE